MTSHSYKAGDAVLCCSQKRGLAFPRNPWGVGVTPRPQAGCTAPGEGLRNAGTQLGPLSLPFPLSAWANWPPWCLLRTTRFRPLHVTPGFSIWIPGDRTPSLTITLAKIIGLPPVRTLFAMFNFLQSTWLSLSLPFSLSVCLSIHACYLIIACFLY